MAADLTPETDQTATDQLAEPKAPARRVVLAEDEAIIRLDLKETLELMGYDVVGDTGRGDEAVDLIRELQPDIAILDIKMPGLDGLSVARKVVEEQICAVLILSAFSQSELVTEATEAGVLGYLVKPFQRSELLPAIEVSMARFAQMKSLADENRKLTEQFEVRKLVDRAKGTLMDQYGLSESASFSFIQQSAMKKRLSMATIAEQILQDELKP